MNDLITAATSGLFVEIGKVIQHMEAQQERIAELERQLAEASAPAVERVLSDKTLQLIIEGVGQARNQSLSRTGTLLLVRRVAGLALAAPQAADTDKVREAIANISNNQITEAWESCGGVGGFYKSFGYQQFAHAVLDIAADTVCSMAVQAPVREVPGKLTSPKRKETIDLVECGTCGGQVLVTVPAAPTEEEE